MLNLGIYRTTLVRNVAPDIVQFAVRPASLRQFFNMDYKNFRVRYRCEHEHAIRTTVVLATSKADAWRIVVSECALMDKLANTLLSIEEFYG